MSAAPARILLVDDRPPNLLALRSILEPLGHALVEAESGEAALRALLRDEFALILLDVQMPGIDGFETATLIKERERTRHVPIIFLTAISKEEQHVFRGYSAGAVDYLFKPFDPDVLRSKVGVFVDLYEKGRRLEHQAEQLKEQELGALERVSAERYRTLAEAMPQIVWTTRPDGSADYVNGRWYEYSGLREEHNTGWSWAPAVHPNDRRATVEAWQAAVAAGSPYECEARFRRGADGSYRWHLIRALPTRDAKEAIAGWVGTCTDIDDQKRTEEAQRFLVEAGSVLGSSLDYRRTLANVVELAVPRVADWVRVDMIEEDGALELLAIAHADPRKTELARELESRYPTAPDSSTGPPHVLRTGESELIPDIADELLAAAAVDELHLGLLRELGLRSSMCVPLVARGRVLGAITLVAAESGRLFGRDDLALVEELARRAATAVDNARLYREVEERARAARVLATVGDGVFLLDRGGVVRLWNPAAEAITGLAAGRMLGQQAATAIPGWAELSARVPVASTPGPPQGGAESVPVEIEGRELWLSFSGVGSEEGTVYAFRDLTEERLVEAMKTDFVATVSHELRTPLAAIYGSALTVRRTDLELDNAMRDRLLEVIEHESNRLAEIVNDLLLASHLDSGRLQVSIERCDSIALARSVVESSSVHLPAGVDLELSAPDELPAVAADPGQLRQVLVNLVDNAIKYSPEGGPVQLRLEQEGEHLRFAVRDEGLGIPPAEHRRIFEKFYRLDPNMTRGIGGTGLGLYICRELVRRVGGRISVESQQGSGSTFVVEMPLAEKPRKPRAKAKAA